MSTQHYEALVIGFGKGGKTLASYLGQRGISVAVVEQSKEMYGGTCINIACIPSKALALAAEASYRQQFKTFDEKAAYYQQALREKDELVAFLRQRNYDMLDKNPQVTVIDGRASFVGAHDVQVSADGQTSVIHAEKIFINTGSLPFIPPIDGLQQSKRVVTSTSLMELEQLPRELLIIGAGYIGLEFASIYAAFGSQVTVIEMNETLLPRQDRDIADAVRSVMEKRGVQFLTGASVERVHDQDDRAVVTVRDRYHAFSQHTADRVLIATGRTPNTQHLGLERAGIEVNERGYIVVDDYLRTTTPDVWALGDVNGGPQFTYISLDDYRIIRDQLNGGHGYSVKDRQYIPYSVFIHPTLSQVGLSEEEARREGRSIQVFRMPAAAVPRARQMGETDGLLKAVVDQQTGQILGCTLFCADSAEVINVVQMAMRAGLDYRAVRDNIYTHPSMTEGLNDLFSQPVQ